MEKHRTWRRGWINLLPKIVSKNSFFRRNNILYGILFEPEALLKLGVDMIIAISSLSVGCRNIVLPFSFAR